MLALVLNLVPARVWALTAPTLQLPGSSSLPGLTLGQDSSQVGFQVILPPGASGFIISITDRTGGGTAYTSPTIMGSTGWVQASTFIAGHAYSWTAVAVTGSTQSGASAPLYFLWAEPNSPSTPPSSPPTTTPVSPPIATATALLVKNSAGWRLTSSNPLSFGLYALDQNGNGIAGKTVYRTDAFTVQPPLLPQAVPIGTTDSTGYVADTISMPANDPTGTYLVTYSADSAQVQIAIAGVNLAPGDSLIPIPALPFQFGVQPDGWNPATIEYGIVSPLVRQPVSAAIQAQIGSGYVGAALDAALSDVGLVGEILVEGGACVLSDGVTCAAEVALDVAPSVAADSALGVTERMIDQQLTSLSAQARDQMKRAIEAETVRYGAAAVDPYGDTAIFDALSLAQGEISVISNAVGEIAGLNVSATDSQGNLQMCRVEFSRPVSDPALVNLSSRAIVAPGNGVMISGLILAGTGTETVLVRAIGPGLSQFGISEVLPHPRLYVYNASGTLVAENEGWGGNQSLAQTFAAVGAFAISSDSTDSALTVSLPGGAYTVTLTGAGNESGAALLEIYDVAAATGSGARLINLSTRAWIGQGAPLTAGMALVGPGQEQLLVRGIGPGLVPFGVSGTVAGTSLELLNAEQTPIAQDTGWANSPQLSQLALQVGAFALPLGSADSAVAANVSAGLYTSIVSDTGSAPGAAMVEIYDAGPSP